MNGIKVRKTRLTNFHFQRITNLSGVLSSSSICGSCISFKIPHDSIGGQAVSLNLNRVHNLKIEWKLFSFYSFVFESVYASDYMSDRTKILQYREWLFTPLNLNLQECSGLRVIIPARPVVLIGDSMQLQYLMHYNSQRALLYYS